MCMCLLGLECFLFSLPKPSNNFLFIFYIVHVRKRSTLMNGSIISADHDTTKFNQSSNLLDDNKLVRPYFLIRPQSVLMLPNETGKRMKINIEIEFFFSEI